MEVDASVFETKSKNPLIFKIRNHIKQYSNLIEERVNIKRGIFAYVKKERSWYWFIIDVVDLCFSYRFTRLNDYLHTPITEENIEKILVIITNLIENYYKSSREVSQTDKPESSISLQKYLEMKKPKPIRKQPPISAAKEVEKEKRVLSLPFFTIASEEEKLFVRSVIQWVKTNYPFITYINLYGIPQFRINESQKCLFWFVRTESSFLFKYRLTPISSVRVFSIDLESAEEIYEIIDAVVRESVKK